ncbi:MAG: archaea-specific SMC-related protein [Salinigranum sp.]
METSTVPRKHARVEVRNVGGIEEAAVDLREGVTILEGRNATNRTSFLQAVMAALGSEETTLKGDADEGSVVLTVGDETYRRSFRRENGVVVADGDPYLEDSELVDLFASLLESNEARRAVTREDDLREVIMRPVDTETIEAEIRERKAERRDVEAQIDELREKKRRLPSLEGRRQSLVEEIEDRRDRLAETEAEIEAAGADPEAEEESSEQEAELERLHDARSNLADVRHREDSERESVEALQEEREELKSELSEIRTSVREISDLGEQIGTLQERKRNLDSRLDRLQSVVQFNRQMLQDDLELREALEDGSRGHVTEELLADEEVACWTCGSHVEKERIRETIDRLTDLRSETVEERKAVVSELEEVKRERDEIERRQQRRDHIEYRLDRIDDELERRRETMTELSEKRERLVGRVEELEATIEEFERADRDRTLELNREANRLEFEIEDLQAELEEVEATIEAVEGELDRLGPLERRRESLKDELAELRNRIDTIEREAVDSFNEHMETALNILEYDNIARIWIERQEREGDEDSTFDLHIVRETDEGTAYEDTVDHLSESEREVTGLIFALAGYLVHDVHDRVPFMVLDSLEAVDAERIAALVEHFREYVPFLLVALLPEDAQALDEYRHVTDI